MDHQPTVSFVSYDRSFIEITGESPSFSLLAESESGEPLFHEACIFHKSTNAIFITSNQILRPELGRSNGLRVTRLYRVYDSVPSTFEDITPTQLAYSMLNGGVNYDESSILLCAQGSDRPQDPSGIVLVSIDPTATVNSPIQTLCSEFQSQPFNSVNDVVVHPEDGSIWFTDPSYGYSQGFRPKPMLPDQVYRYDPKTGSICAVADNFDRPNGLCFSPELETLYITDTGAISGRPGEPIDPDGKSHIYAFTVAKTPAGAPYLTNRRLFAYVPSGCPDGIKTDMAGNVYSGCLDGIHVWDSNGVRLGKICVEGGVANFCFGIEGCLYLCNETKVWKVQLKRSVRGALLKL